MTEHSWADGVRRGGVHIALPAGGAARPLDAPPAGGTGPFGPGLQAELDGDALRITALIPGGAAEAEGFKVGDRITAIDGEAVSAVLDARIEAAGVRTARPDRARRRFARRPIGSDEPGLSVVVTFERGDEPPRDIEVFSMFVEPRVAGPQLPIAARPVGGALAGRSPDDLIYIRPQQFDATLVNAMLVSIQGDFARGMVIDLRGVAGSVAAAAPGDAGQGGNAVLLGGAAAFDPTSLAPIFLPEAPAKPGGDAPGLGVDRFTGPVAVLTDGDTAGAAEHLALWLRHAGVALVFGPLTAGEVLPMVELRVDGLPAGISVPLASGYSNRPWFDPGALVAGLEADVPIAAEAVDMAWLDAVRDRLDQLIN